ncbi:hypothetical protein JTB14_010529 [Gonioctena quinquepunctata]|nr:hypothetical protein JTB14_010529 [Gonioctena quinquepunctata]
MAPLVPTLISQINQEEGGHAGRVLGEVLYIMRCLPKSAIIRRTNKCYHELPIEINNQSKFMAPVTRILQDHAGKLINGLIPPLYFIDNEWIGLAPHPTLKRAPMEIGVEMVPKLNFSPIMPIGSAGLYTQDEVTKVQKILTFGSERQAVENIIARRVTGLETTGQGFSTLNIFNPDEMKELAHSTMKQLWGWFIDIGIFMSGLIGFYTVHKTLKYAIGVALNGFHLYKTVGCGIMLLASLRDTLTMWVTYRQHASGRTDSQSEIRKVQIDPEINETVKDEPLSTKNIYPNLPKVSHWTDTFEQ